MNFFKTVKNVFGLEIEKPNYEVINKIGDNIEIRKYAPSKWVSTTVEGEASHYKSDYQTQMFRRLFNYISGSNENHEKISMTSPVTVVYDSSTKEKIQPSTDCKMTMGFYVPIEKQDHTPQPSSQDTFLREEPEMIAATIKFGGYVTTDDYLNYRDQLVAALGEEAKNYDAVNFMTAGYDPPFKPINRTNEVWLRKIY